jgi:hypothetical protein
MNNILDIANKYGWDYAQQFVVLTFGSYKDAKRWAKLTITNEQPSKLAAEDMKKWGYCFDWLNKESKIPWWWSADSNKQQMLTAYYKGKFNFCHKLLRGELTLPFSRK